MNLLEDYASLTNRYFTLRHGQSRPNVDARIVSHPREGIKKEQGLTDFGKEQVRKSVADALETKWLTGGVIIETSAFSRHTQSAAIAAEVLGIKNPFFSVGLHERWFGDWEGTHNSNYQKVWDEDMRNPAHTLWNVESVEKVQERTACVVVACEELYYKRNILLVSSGDPLQILQTAFMKISPARHREIPHLETAEIRELVLNP